EISPKCRCGDSCDVPAADGRSRCAAYSVTSSAKSRALRSASGSPGAQSEKPFAQSGLVGSNCQSDSFSLAGQCAGGAIMCGTDNGSSGGIRCVSARQNAEYILNCPPAPVVISRS